MSFLSPRDGELVRAQLEGSTRCVRLRFFTQTFGCETCADAARSPSEVVELSSKGSVEECNLVLEPERATAFGVERAPTIAVIAADEEGKEVDYGVRFVGVPSGYEFSSLLDAIQIVSSGDSKLSEASR